jgi:putative spermidine/putrescine transport system ATP-binding protein
MDEPLSNLDAGLRVDLRAQIKRLHESLGLTTVYVTHDQNEALSLASTVVVMRDGHVEQIGPPQVLYRSPASAYVARFMGYRNTFSAKVSDADGKGVWVDFGGGTLAGTWMSPTAVRRGDDVTLAVHPDDLTLAGSREPGGIEVTVDVVEYHGRSLEAEVRTADGVVLRIENTQPLRRGEALTLTARPDRVLVYPGSQIEHLQVLEEQVA